MTFLPGLTGLVQAVREATLTKHMDVAAAVFTCRDKVLIARRAPGQNHGGQWEFPGGKIRNGESPMACLHREIQEELGVTIHQTSFFMNSQWSYPSATVNLFVFIVHSFSPTFHLHVHDATQWVMPCELETFDLLEADIAVAKALQNQKDICRLSVSRCPSSNFHNT
ncbi:(deoxy)nucleoside triphosphate pyrophosphohydrolase [Desulfobotulus sp. H1]|uniref:8-oxo-dGTP diphosphatase n=1 Tax=Desulfobotulus pelophilus TaxID=2823377 RepID=A0ABT3NAR0_9BACT|nr:(deoxy)nucleoside triphosphate pyrophosphohydrolase [Desulfobotulus pelophilus]MCW7754554.1 (deoxy)nucleoside triphosphate pyrophosphohydrolase [Desulfobotulus pelophilus]